MSFGPNRIAKQKAFEQKVRLLMSNYAEVCKALDAALIKVANLEREVASLTSEVVDDMPYEDFKALVKEKLGVTRGWYDAFVLQSNYKQSELTKWKAQDRVPGEVIEKCHALKPISQVPSSHWKDEWVVRLVELNEGLKESTELKDRYPIIAERLNADFSQERVFTNGAVKGMVSKVESGKRVVVTSTP